MVLTSGNLVDQAYILTYKEYTTHYYHAVLITKLHGKIKVSFPKYFVPQYCYLYNLQWLNTKYPKAINIQISLIHKLQNLHLLAAFYALEWLDTLSPLNMSNYGLFHMLKITLSSLELAVTNLDIEKALRIYERQSLAHLGYGLNVSHIEHLHSPYISYDPNEGYSEHEYPQGPAWQCLPRAEIYKILTDQYNDLTTLKLSKCWMRFIFKMLLPQHQWQCHSLFHQTLIN